MGVRWLFLVAVGSTVALAETPLRREASPGFGVDVAFQDRGGVQYFYELVRADQAAALTATFSTFRPFDVHDVWKRLDAPTNVVMSRLVYTIEKDVSFFTEARARDVDYINAIAREARVSRNDDGTFRASRTPANTFRIEYFDAARVQAVVSALPALARVLELSGLEGPPHAVIFQENRDFDRVMGFRTAEGSFTWTAHYPAGRGRTRLVVFVMSYLHTLPPFFLGGETRVFRESTEGARVLIDRLRDYRAN
ncbi:MAG: hypothetical protein INH41_15100 [Myxococcaceae bacterium]|jgi:hypothetical protein|nr:hypothetical protein [Myxococcaceae bacterium]MCA3013708.1 hypothetical protein [Myxococcaceae bacterium]